MSSHAEAVKNARAIAREARALSRQHRHGSVGAENVIALDTELRRLRTQIRSMVELQMVGEHVGVETATFIGQFHKLMRVIGMVPRCRRCSCTEERACPRGCFWIQVSLCSRCDPS